MIANYKFKIIKKKYIKVQNYIFYSGEMPINREENYNQLIKTGINGPLTERGIAEVNYTISI